MPDPTVVWASASGGYWGEALGFAGQIDYVEHIDDVPPTGLTSNARMFAIMASSDLVTIGVGLDTGSGFVGLTRRNYWGLPNQTGGGLFLSGGFLSLWESNDVRIALGGSLDVYKTVTNVLGSPTVISSNGLCTAWIFDSPANDVSFTAHNGGFGPHGSVGADPPLGDAAAAAAGSTSDWPPALMADPGTFPMLAFAGRVDNVSGDMFVGWPDPEPDWTTIVAASSPEYATGQYWGLPPYAVIASLFISTGGVFNSHAEWGALPGGITWNTVPPVFSGNDVRTWFTSRNLIPATWNAVIPSIGRSYVVFI